MENKIYVSLIETPGSGKFTRFVKMKKDLLPVNLAKDGSYYSPEGKSFPIYEEKDLIESTLFKEEIYFSDLETIKFLEKKKSMAFKKFVDELNDSDKPEVVQEAFDSIIKIGKQLKLAEDSFLTYVLTKKIEEYNKNYGV